MSPFPTPCKGKSKSQPFAHTFALTGRWRLYTDTQGVALGCELLALSGRSFSRFVRLSCAHALPLIIWPKNRAEIFPDFEHLSEKGKLILKANGRNILRCRQYRQAIHFFFATNVKNRRSSNTYLILFTYLCNISLTYIKIHIKIIIMAGNNHQTIAHRL